MWPNPQETEDLVTFTEKILIRKLHFLRSGFLKVTLSYMIFNLIDICYRLCCQNLVSIVLFEK